MKVFQYTSLQSRSVRSDRLCRSQRAPNRNFSLAAVHVGFSMFGIPEPRVCMQGAGCGTFMAPVCTEGQPCGEGLSPSTGDQFLGERICRPSVPGSGNPSPSPAPIGIEQPEPASMPEEAQEPNPPPGGGACASLVPRLMSAYTVMHNSASCA